MAQISELNTWFQISGTSQKRPKKGERPVGVPAARGHGVMEVQKLEVPAAGPAAPKVALQSLLLGAAQCPESFSMMPGGVSRVDRPLGSFIPSTNVPPRAFASLPLPLSPSEFLEAAAPQW